MSGSSSAWPGGQPGCLGHDPRFVFQVSALRSGPLDLVQPVLALELALMDRFKTMPSALFPRAAAARSHQRIRGIKLRSRWASATADLPHCHGLTSPCHQGSR
jgi:hypothetical protein